MPVPNDENIAVQIEAAKQKKWLIEADNLMAREVICMAIPAKLSHIANKTSLSLFEALQPRLLDGVKVPYTELTSDQKERLAMAIMCTLLRNISPGYCVLYNKLAPFMVDISQTELFMNGPSSISFGTTMTKGDARLFIGGAAQIDPSTEGFLDTFQSGLP